MHTSTNRGDRAIRRLLLLTVGCLVIAWCSFAVANISSAPSRNLSINHQVDMASGPRRGDAHDTASVPDALQPRLIREDASSSALVLIVRDEAGSPISGAAVAHCPEGGARTLSITSRIGDTNQAGEIAVPLEGGILAEGSLLVASARGYVPKSIKCPGVPGRYEIALQAGSVLEIECRDFSAIPLPGLRVAVSRATFPASVWRDTPPDRRDIGSDPITTIMHGTTDDSGQVIFDGISPGDYFVRAESDSHLLASTNSKRKVLGVGPGTARHLLTCGTICVAALEVNVPPEEVVYYDIVGAPSHVNAGFVQEALDLRRRDIESKFSRCHAVVSLATGVSGSDMGYAKFRYSTLRHGDFVHDVQFVELAAFKEPATYVAQEVASPPIGEVTLRIEGDHGVARERLRVELLRTRRSVSGITCVEGDTRLVPAGQYVIELNDREMSRALEVPPVVDVIADIHNEVILKVREGLVPLTISIEMPLLLRGQFVSLIAKGPDGVSRWGRTRGDRSVVWLPAGVYEVTAESAWCKAIARVVTVSSSETPSITLRMEGDI